MRLFPIEVEHDSLMSQLPFASLPKIKRIFRQIAEQASVPAKIFSAIYSPDAVPNMCYWNVAALVKAHGGKPLYCWRAFWLENVFVHVQHHAVWEAPNGTVRDVTPFGNWVAVEPTVYLLRDTTRVPDLQMPPKYPNIIIGLKHIDAVDRLRRADQRVIDAETLVMLGGTLADKEALDAANQEYQSAQMALIVRHRRPT